MAANAEASFPVPEDEDERLADLHAYEILDTAPERTYNDLTRLAAKVCERPMAAITFIDEHRQWVKAEVGGGAKSSPRSESFCARAIADPDDVYVVEDATEHPAFEDNPLVQEEPELRFYAGAPIHSFRGHGLGTICVLDTDTGTLGGEEASALRALSRTVSLQLELRRHGRHVRRAKEDMELFAAAIRDDVRDDVAVIQAALHALGARVDEFEGSARAELEEGQRAARQLERTAEGLESYVQIAARRDPMEAIAVREALEEATEQLAVGAPEPQRVEGHGLPVVWADQHQLTVLLHRLLALLRDAGGQAAIHVSAHRGEGRWRIRLSTDARAVDRERWSRWQGAVTSDDPPEAIEGVEGDAWTLALCRRIADRHGGEVGLEPVSDEELAIWFTLPGPAELGRGEQGARSGSPHRSGDPQA